MQCCCIYSSNVGDLNGSTVHIATLIGSDMASSATWGFPDRQFFSASCQLAQIEVITICVIGALGNTWRYTCYMGMQNEINLEK